MSNLQLSLLTFVGSVLLSHVVVVHAPGGTFPPFYSWQLFDRVPKGLYDLHLREGTTEVTLLHATRLEPPLRAELSRKLRRKGNRSAELADYIREALRGTGYEPVAIVRMTEDVVEHVNCGRGTIPSGEVIYQFD